jgi:hypothetical protein
MLPTQSHVVVSGFHINPNAHREFAVVTYVGSDDDRT